MIYRLIESEEILVVEQVLLAPEARVGIIHEIFQLEIPKFKQAQALAVTMYMNFPEECVALDQRDPLQRRVS